VAGSGSTAPLTCSNAWGAPRPADSGGDVSLAVRAAAIGTSDGLTAAIDALLALFRLKWLRHVHAAS